MSNALEFEAYCLKCKAKRTYVAEAIGEFKNGTPVAKGTCPVCGSALNRMLSKGAADEARAAMA